MKMSQHVKDVSISKILPELDVTKRDLPSQCQNLVCPYMDVNKYGK